MKRIFSEYIIVVEKEKKRESVSILLSKELPYKKTSLLPDGRMEIYASYRQHKEICKCFYNESVEHKITENKGILSVFSPLKGRIGLYIGMIFMLVTLIYSSNIVWCINVEGNRKLTDEEIINELHNVGFDLGDYVPKIDYDKLQNKVLLNSDDLAWISININGNVANVKVKEKLHNEKENKKVLYSNIVAKSDGYITSISVIDGKKAVNIGNVVKKGEILISGVIDSQAEGVRYEQARGEVLAYVNKKISVEIPLNSTKKVYTGVKYKNKSYKIYNFPLFFSSNYGNQSGFYDTIEKKEKLCFMGIKNIPITVITTACYEYELIDVNLSVEEASQLANIELKNKLDAALCGSTIINKSVSTRCDGERYYLDCELYCLEDIALEQEFFVTE
ncbi:MAG: sporulation protein YqfD [Clostridia bacterium]|nr:sporulation protein YqfD [Clostridia bacterium]